MEEFSPENPPIAECYSEEGFRTGMISNLIYPCPWLMNGFQDIYPPGREFQGGYPEEVTKESSRWLENHADEDFFLFAHYWTPHYDYFKRSEKTFRDMFSPDEYEDHVPDLGYIKENETLRSRFKSVSYSGLGEKIDVAQALAAYDSNIRYVDENIKKLIEKLEELGIRDETLIVFTSDHGEAFGEYGFWEHLSCYRNVSKIPLIIEGLSIQNNKVPQFTQHIDIMPTLLQLSGLEGPDKVSGRKMNPLLNGREDQFRKEVVVNTEHGSVQRMFIRDNYALVHALEKGDWSHLKKYELFDLQEDPEQTNDLSCEMEEKTQEMRLALDDWLTEKLANKPDPLQLSYFRKHDSNG
ncbi:hypothetical protein AKJ64_04305 [candidate division MSBL1 archaeon SCGC-AAA259E17]|uniref:Sulfatase N-terminal domain-containing protein n=1 Tax=candidate division MSBL1 archaeon SCGC-AAA259E17 TaxID=1698263 RepID=A0A133UCQ3_9EURY|nr:hypothetical protein AKJ64_04305 [candidate division MSBL1 archaeon SCGC-AAA259E17]